MLWSLSCLNRASRLLEQRAVALDRVDAAAQRREHRGLIAGAGADSSTRMLGSSSSSCVM